MSKIVQLLAAVQGDKPENGFRLVMVRWEGQMAGVVAARVVAWALTEEGEIFPVISDTSNGNYVPYPITDRDEETVLGMLEPGDRFNAGEYNDAVKAKVAGRENRLAEGEKKAQTMTELAESIDRMSPEERRKLFEQLRGTLPKNG